MSDGWWLLIGIVVYCLIAILASIVVTYLHARKIKRARENDERFPDDWLGGWVMLCWCWPVIPLMALVWFGIAAIDSLSLLIKNKIYKHVGIR